MHNITLIVLLCMGDIDLYMYLLRISLGQLVSMAHPQHSQASDEQLRKEHSEYAVTKHSHLDKQLPTVTQTKATPH